jgi:hypothetical protein
VVVAVTEQLGLFGDSQAIRNPEPAHVDSNDIELMQIVAGNAVRCGYLLVGPSERVYARVAGDEVQRVPRYEEDAVHQLLRRRWLTTGGNHHITCGAASLIGMAVLVPKDTRLRVTRWDRLQRPTSWPRRQPARTR